MTDTVVSSETREVVIGFDRPFVLIGERINPTGRRLLAEEMKSGDFSRVEQDALAQVGAGAQMLDVNAGIPLADEPALLAKAIELVQSLTDVPLSIDSSIVAALEAGLSVYKGKALVNSVTGEEERLEQVLPLVARHGAAVVAISNDETGISEDPDVRFEVAKKIVQRAADHGIKPEDVVVDPLVMPIGAMGTAGQQVFRLVRRLREGKTFAFCDECGAKVSLPEIEKPTALGAKDAHWIRREEALARLRSAYEAHLVRVKGFRRDRAAPRCYLSYVTEQSDWAAQLASVAVVAAIDTGDWDWALATIRDLDDEPISQAHRIDIAATHTILRHLRGVPDPRAPLKRLSPLPDDLDPQVRALVDQADAWGEFVKGRFTKAAQLATGAAAAALWFNRHSDLVLAARVEEPGGIGADVVADVLVEGRGVRDQDV